MTTVLLIIHVLVAIVLVGLVLIQHGQGADAGAAFGSGASGTVFGARGAASFLTRTTAVLATVFFLTSIALTYLAAHRPERGSVTDTIAAPAQPAPETPAPKPAPAQLPD
jgi:preprotein translocase subunit SecG